MGLRIRAVGTGPSLGRRVLGPEHKEGCEQDGEGLRPVRPHGGGNRKTVSASNPCPSRGQRPRAEGHLQPPQAFLPWALWGSELESPSKGEPSNMLAVLSSLQRFQGSHFQILTSSEGQCWEIGSKWRRSRDTCEPHSAAPTIQKEHSLTGLTFRPTACLQLLKQDSRVLWRASTTLVGTCLVLSGGHVACVQHRFVPAGNQKGTSQGTGHSSLPLGK